MHVRLKQTLALALLMVTLCCYLQVRHHEFVYWDDPDYITNNFHVRGPFSLTKLTWALQAMEAFNWHPLTWMSHILDYHVYGMWAGGHHLTSVLLHCANVLLLFLLLQRMTGAPWRSALCTMLFAIHPLHVESVAWVSERKDVLSTFFGLLALWAYLRHVERPGFWRYLPVLLLYAMSLMSKPMLVTLPPLLLLLDRWPLRRPAQVLLIYEKLPMLLLSAGISVITVLAQHGGGAMRSLSRLGLRQRIDNAVVAYAFYLEKTVLPRNLAFLYPHPFYWPPARVWLSALLLSAISLLVLLARRGRPHLVVGWLWFLGTLVPVIGLVQVGDQSYADRYTYVPQCGLFIMIAWSLPAAWFHGRGRALCTGTVIGAVLAAFFTASYLQIGTWRTSQVLFERGVRLTPRNHVGYNWLGVLAYERGDVAGAIAYYRQSLGADDWDVNAHDNLGNALCRQGHLDEGLPHIVRAARQGYDLSQFDNVLRAALQQSGRTPEEIAAFYQRLGEDLLRDGKPGFAATYFREVLRRQPDLPEAHNGLGQALWQLGQRPQARIEFLEALRIDPGFTAARRNLDQP